MASTSNSFPGLMRDGDRSRVEWKHGLKALDAAIEGSLADADAGRLQDADAVFDRLEAAYSAMVRAHER